MWVFSRYVVNIPLSATLGLQSSSRWPWRISGLQKYRRTARETGLPLMPGRLDLAGVLALSV
jgi:hypothetical protein